VAKCKCGNDMFYAHQLVRVDVVVDEMGNFVENLNSTMEASVYDAERPYGGFRCTECGTEYENIPSAE